MIRFLALAGAVAAGLAAVGVFLTRGGAAGGREAMFWACGVVFLGALAGAMPLVSAAPATGASVGAGPAAVSRFLAAILLRMGAVAVGATGVILLGGVEPRPFLLWLAAGYLVFLIPETAFALRQFRSL